MKLWIKYLYHQNGSGPFLGIMTLNLCIRTTPRTFVTPYLGIYSVHGKHALNGVTCMVQRHEPSLNMIYE